MLRKNDIVTLKITDITGEGNGVGHFDGEAVFVPFSAVGDDLRVKIVKAKSSFAFGITEEIIKPSNDRIKPDCRHFKNCGGCVFRHILYRAELAAKKTFVKDCFERIGGICVPEFEIFLGSEQFYRNKAVYRFAEISGELSAGFYFRRSHRVVEAQGCKLLPPDFEKIANAVAAAARLLKISAYDEVSGKGLLRHIYIRRGFHSGETMLCLIAAKRDDRLLTLLKTVAGAFDITTTVLNINPEKTNVILGSTGEIVTGEGFITDSMCGKLFKISPDSFYQVNTPQAEKLYIKAGEYAKLSGKETLLDLYCGVGTIGITLAGSVKKLIGAEIVPKAIENARENAEINGLRNAEFFAGDAGKTAQKLAEDGVQPDVIVADPARKGMDKTALDAVIKMSPKRFVMVSCNPATAARDVKYLSENGYKLAALTAFDLFPRTEHVETVVLMSRVKDTEA